MNLKPSCPRPAPTPPLPLPFSPLRALLSSLGALDGPAPETSRHCAPPTESLLAFKIVNN